MATEGSPTHRLPLMLKPENRDQTSLKDAKLVNGFAEKYGEDEYQIYKRPGLSVYQSVTAAAGAGCYNWNGNIYAVFGTTLYRNGVSIGTVDGTNGRYSFSSNQNVVPQLFLHNGVMAYVWNGSTLSTVANNLSTVQSFTATTTATSTTVSSTSINTSLLAVGDAISGAGIPNGTYIASITNSSTIVLTLPATASASGVNIQASGAGYPGSSSTPICHGVAWLDGTMYVMDTSAKIWASNYNDSTAWPGNFLTAQSEQDGGVAIARQLTYVIAMKQWTTEVFYDAANSTGSPLAPVQASKQPFGCANADTVVSVSDRLFWLATNRSGAKQVVIMENVVCRVVSSPAIERLLDNANVTQAYGWQHKEMGHIFYGITFPLANLTIVYDLESKMWYLWTDPNGNYFPVVDSTYITSNEGHIMQHISNGDLMTPAETNYNDLGVVFPVDLYTPKFDGNTRFNKYLTSLEVIGDTTSGSSMKVRFSDDDYQTWTNFRVVDLSNQRPMLWDCGTFRARAFHFRHLANTFMRIKAVDLQLMLGTL